MKKKTRQQLVAAKKQAITNLKLYDMQLERAGYQYLFNTEKNTETNLERLSVEHFAKSCGVDADDLREKIKRTKKREAKLEKVKEFIMQCVEKPS